MVTGIKPREASDRLTVFQARFDELYRKFETYAAGEELFGNNSKRVFKIFKLKFIRE